MRQTLDRDPLRLELILESIARIESFLKGRSFEKFALDTLTIDAVLLNFVLINERAKNLDRKGGGRSWQNVINAGERAEHDYYNVEPKVVWDTVQNDLPLFKKEVEKLLR